MQAIDQAFFEAYKRLDRLCSDAFSCRNGVTAYIDEMNRCSPRGQRLVPGWEQDLSTLKALRHLRNRMAHELDTDGVCTEADAAEAGDFHARILSGNDPLARLNRMAAPEKKPPIARMPENVSCSGSLRTPRPPTGRRTGEQGDKEVHQGAPRLVRPKTHS